MLLKEENDICIFVTIRKIRNIDVTITTLKQSDELDDLAILHWEKLKSQMTDELIELLSVSGIRLPIAA